MNDPLDYPTRPTRPTRPMPPSGTTIFFGWKVVATAFAVALFAWGLGFYGPSVFLHALHAKHGWSVSIISAAITTHFLFSALLVLRLPEAHRRLGTAGVTAAAIASLGLGVVGWSIATAPWQLFAASLLTGAGWAGTSGAAINAMVAPWFDRRRPAAIGMAFNGASAGGVIFMPLWTVLIERLGTAGAATTVLGAMLALLWPLIYGYLRPTPAGLGTTPDGGPLSRPDRPPPQRPPLSRRALLRERRFATLSGAFALGLFAQIGLFTHLLSRLVPVLGDGGAAAAVSLTTVMAILGRTLLGWLIGRRDRRIAAAGNFLLQASGTALLAAGTDIPIVLAGCVLFGLGVGNLVSLPPLIAQSEFEAVDVARVVALITAVNQAVFAFAPGILGALRDVTGGYAVPIALAALVQLAAALLALAGRRRAASGPGNAG